jgi:hypothetical protein
VPLLAHRSSWGPVVVGVAMVVVVALARVPASRTHASRTRREVNAP